MEKNAKAHIILQVSVWPSYVYVFSPMAVDEAGKMVTGDGEKVTMEAALEEQDGEDKDEDGQEVIKVYIFKADSGEEDLGKIWTTIVFPQP